TTDNTNTDTTASTNSSDNVRATINDMNEQFMQALKNKDSAAIAAMYSSDAWIMPPNSEAVKGNDIAAFWGGIFRMGIADVKFDIQDVTVDGNLAAETSTFELLDSTGKTLDKGKYVVVWKKENGQWKLYRDIFNSNMPAPGAK
ncbi:MAG TPA: DUF4440 domain-containing protein, partial [Flavisolibacter sp.]|nr:DUF4440 domain-containing protein [Flavisolibacter sp.]